MAFGPLRDAGPVGSLLAASGTGASWIIAGVALMCLLEDSVGLGVVLPAETVVIAAAASAAHGMVPLWAVFLVAWLCAAAGDTIGFCIGRRWGRVLLDRYGARVGLTPPRIDQADAFFDHWGVLGVAFGRLVPAVRTVIMPVAGASNLDWRRFVVADLFGTAVWATLHVTVGYLVGLGLNDAARSGLVVGLVLLAVGGVAGWWAWRRHNQRSDDPQPDPSAA